jgi:TM2 domain-containing membrane protein YozV
MFFLHRFYGSRPILFYGKIAPNGIFIFITTLLSSMITNLFKISQAQGIADHRNGGQRHGCSCKHG